MKNNCALLCIFFFGYAAVHAQSSNQSDSVPYVRVCAALPESFWKTASNEELVVMLENNHQEADTAVQVLIKRCHTDLIGYSGWRWFEYSSRIARTAQGSQFLSYFLDKTRVLDGNTDQIAYEVLIPFALQNPDDTVIVPQLIRVGTSPKKVDMYNQGLLRALFHVNQFNVYRDSVYRYWSRYGGNAEFEWILSESKIDSTWKTRALQTIVNRPVSSSGIARYIQLYPQFAKLFWEKAHSDNICINEKDALQILSVGKLSNATNPAEQEYSPELTAIQLNCITELTKIGFFSDPVKVGDLISGCNLSRASKVEEGIVEAVQSMSFDSLSLKHLVNLISFDCTINALKQKAKVSLEKWVESYPHAKNPPLSDMVSYGYRLFHNEHEDLGCSINALVWDSLRTIASPEQVRQAIEAMKVIPNEDYYQDDVVHFFAKVVAAIKTYGDSYLEASVEKKIKLLSKAIEKYGISQYGESVSKDVSFLNQALEQSN